MFDCKFYYFVSKSQRGLITEQNKLTPSSEYLDNKRKMPFHLYYKIIHSKFYTIKAGQMRGVQSKLN